MGQVVFGDFTQRSSSRPVPTSGLASLTGIKQARHASPGTFEERLGLAQLDLEESRFSEYLRNISAALNDNTGLDLEYRYRSFIRCWDSFSKSLGELVAQYYVEDPENPQLTIIPEIKRILGVECMCLPTAAVFDIAIDRMQRWEKGG